MKQELLKLWTNYLENRSTEAVAYMMTGYEWLGVVALDDFFRDNVLIIDENLLVSLYREYLLENDPENALFEFDDETLKMLFSDSDPLRIMQAVFFGKIQNWNDDYIRFDGYGNLESVNEYQVAQEAKKDSFFHGNLWFDLKDDVIAILKDIHPTIEESIVAMLQAGY